MRRIWAKRGLAGALATLAFVAACGGGDDSEDASSGSREGNGQPSTTAAESTTTSGQPTLTTVAGEGQAEWLEVVNDLEIRLAQLYADPDPERLGDIISDQCACYQVHYDNLVAMVDEGQRVVGESTHVLFVKVEQAYENGDVRLTVKSQAGAGQFLDGDGSVLEEFDVSEPACGSLLVRPDGPGGTYRIIDQVDLDGCPPEAG